MGTPTVYRGSATVKPVVQCQRHERDATTENNGGKPTTGIEPVLGDPDVPRATEVLSAQGVQRATFYINELDL